MSETINIMAELDHSFPETEGDYIRKNILPDFEWMKYTLPTEPNELNKPLRECKIALITTSGAYVVGKQEPFDTGNRFGDDSFRIIPNDTKIEDIALAHLGYDTKRAIKDLDCVFPIKLLNKLYEDGYIGSVNSRHFSFMGYIPKPEKLIWVNAPKVGKLLIDDGVDLVILIPS